MSRRKGSRNKNYEQERARLSQLVFDALVGGGDTQLSFRSLADACGVSPSTMRHYFQDREGVVLAAMEHAGRSGAPYMDMVGKAELGPPAESFIALLRYLSFGWHHTVLGDAHRVGLEVGLNHESLGPSYVRELLEPTLQTFAARIQLHIDRGELMPCHTRFAAISLVSPLILAMLHQQQLNGCGEFPLDMDEFIQEHTRAFLRAHAPISQDSNATPQLSQ